MREKVIIVSLLLIFALNLSARGCLTVERGIADKVIVTENAEILSGEELQDIKKWIDDEIIRKRFLYSTYDCSENIDLYSLFYCGNGEKLEITVDNVRAFLKEFGWWGDFDVYYISITDVDEILKEYIGMSLDDTNKVHLNDLYYVEAEDRYYSVHGNITEEEFKPVYGYKQNEMNYIYYKSAANISTHMKGYFRVTLAANDNGYYFVANEYCDESLDNITYRTEIYSDDYTYSINETIEIQTVYADTRFSSTSEELAIAKIKNQTGFNEVEILGQSWTDVSEYGTIISGTLNGNVCLYFVTHKGEVLPLPIPYTSAIPTEMMFSGGNIIFEYMMQYSNVKLEPEIPTKLTSWYCTLLLPTNEVYIRTVESETIIK